MAPKHRIKSTLLTIVVIAVSLGICETFIRMAPGHFGNIKTYTQRLGWFGCTVNGVFHPTWPFWRADTRLAFALKQNMDIDVTQNDGASPYHITTNSIGFRFDEKLLKRSNKVMVLGDSLAFGHGVNDEDSFVSQLNRHSPGSNTYLNFGTGGWSLAEYYLTYQQFKTRVKPRQVVMTIFLGNDMWELDHSDWDGRADGKLPTAPLKRLDYTKVDPEGHLISQSLAYRYPLLRESALWVTLDTQLLTPLREGALKSKTQAYPVSNTDMALAMINAIHDEVPLTIVLIPARQPSARADTEFVQQLKAIPNLRIIDATPMIDTMNTSLEAVSLYYLPDGTHFTAAGNKRLADALRKALAR